MPSLDLSPVPAQPCPDPLCSTKGHETPALGQRSSLLASLNFTDYHTCENDGLEREWSYCIAHRSWMLEMNDHDWVSPSSLRDDSGAHVSAVICEIGVHGDVVGACEECEDLFPSALLTTDNDDSVCVGCQESRELRREREAESSDYGNDDDAEDDEFRRRQDYDTFHAPRCSECSTSVLAVDLLTAELICDHVAEERKSNGVPVLLSAELEALASV